MNVMSDYHSDHDRLGLKSDVGDPGLFGDKQIASRVALAKGV
jgi:hypothetical protein